MDKCEDCDVESFLKCGERVEEAEPGICGQSWSNAGSLPLADDDRRESLAEHQEDSWADSQSQNHRRYIVRKSNARHAGSTSFSMCGVMETRVRRLSISHH